MVPPLVSLMLASVFVGPVSPRPHSLSVRLASGVHQPMSADTGAAAVTPVPLTASLLTQYLACRKALLPFLTAHPALQQMADAMSRPYSLQGSGYATTVPMSDYSAMVRRDTALAALFKRQRVSADQYVRITLSVLQAAMDAAAQQPPAPTTVAGRNVALVVAHKSEVSDLYAQAMQIQRMINGSIVGAGRRDNSNDNLNP